MRVETFKILCFVHSLFNIKYGTKCAKRDGHCLLDHILKGFLCKKKGEEKK